MSAPKAGAQRIAAAFDGHGRAAAFMPYMMAGFPSLPKSKDIAAAYADGGADLVELGVPFSDPLADGPVIAAAGTQALRAGTKLADVLEVCEVLSARLPVVVMVYSNLVLAKGADVFCAALRDAGASGLIVPDLPMEEAPAVLEAADATGIALVPLVAPTTPDSRLEQIGSRARGFLYTVSVVGTTGERASLSDRFESVVTRAKAATDVPVALGFGISTPEHAAQAAAAGADGVIVGTRLVRAAAEDEDVRGVVEALVRGLER